jgi:hypothetical protein
MLKADRFPLMHWRHVNLSSDLQDKSKNKTGNPVLICSSDYLSNDVKCMGGNADVISHFPVQQDDDDRVTLLMNPVFLFTFHLKAGSTTLIFQAKIIVSRWKKNIVLSSERHRYTKLQLFCATAVNKR